MILDFTEKILKNFLNLYWLRPETAIWRTLDTLQIKNRPFQSPILDAGCGDGSFTFTHFLGQTSSSFDVYTTIKNTEKYFHGKDIHNQTSSVKPKIIKSANKKIDFGIDWKENLLDKAKNYKIYKKLVKHNLNKKFPFENDKFKTIFSNIIYWIDDPEFSLSETFRILDKNGEVILFLPDEKFRKHLIFNQYIKNNFKWAKILDRGIHDNVKHCYSHNEWKKIFNNTGFKIKFHSTHLSNNLIKFWSIGLRPYSPFLIEMANKLEISEKVKIKKRLIEELYPLFRSYIDYELISPTKNNCFHMYVLTK